jgi:outer membrane protein TolC
VKTTSLAWVPAVVWMVASALAESAVAQVPTAPARPAGAAAPGGREPSGFDMEIESLVKRPGGLTADQAAERARSLSYEAEARRADSAAAEARVHQAELGYVPRVVARGLYTRVSDVGLQSFGNVVTAPGAPTGPVAATGAAPTPLANTPLGFTYPLDNWSLQADVVVPISDYVLRVAKQCASAKHSAKAAALTAKAADATASSNARIEYYAWTKARLQEIVAASALELSSEHLADVRSNFAAGQASQADVMQVEAQKADRELLVARARSAIAIEEDRLRTMLHDPPRATYEIGEPLLAPLPPLSAQGDFAALLDEALRKRPELSAIREMSDGLRDEASQARIGLFPKLDAFGSAQYANPNPRYFPPLAAWKGTWAVGAMVSWSSPDAILGGTSASAAESRAAGASAEFNAVRDGIRDEVMQAFRAVHDAEVACDSTERSLSAAEEAYRVRRALFRAAQATSTELGDTEVTLTRARFAAIDARIDLRIARARLVHAVGRDVDRRP